MMLHKRVEWILYGSAYRVGGVDAEFECFDTDFDWRVDANETVLIRIGGMLFSADQLRDLANDAFKLQRRVDREARNG